MRKLPLSPLALWLLSTGLLIWGMIVLGGVTRLTHSGLSIVEWKPITGVLPPLTDLDWQAAFADYQQYPEYKLVNRGMSLGDFQFIYLMEYTHRLLGRLIGLVFIIPLIIFWMRGRLSPFLKKRSMVILSLGLAQGIMGWYMVKSGLVKDPVVSPYRLTAHLALAFLILGLILWTLFDLQDRPRKTPSPFILLTFGLQILTILYGGLVAGLKAGLIYNTFPLMGGKVFPAEAMFYSPLWINFFKNPALVQWCHRLLAVSSLIAVWICYCRFEKSRLTLLWALALSLQVIFGILTLFYCVPISLGVLHQGWGAVVFGLGCVSIFWNNFQNVCRLKS